MTVTSDPASDAVFAQAATQAITRTNLGGHVQVSLGSYIYTVAIPDRWRALIEYRRGFGGLEFAHINATPEQDAALRKQMESK